MCALFEGYKAAPSKIKVWRLDAVSNNIIIYQADSRETVWKT